MKLSQLLLILKLDIIYFYFLFFLLCLTHTVPDFLCIISLVLAIMLGRQELYNILAGPRKVVENLIGFTPQYRGTSQRNGPRKVVGEGWIIIILFWKKIYALPGVPTIMCKKFKLIPFIVFEFYAQRQSQSVTRLAY